MNQNLFIWKLGSLVIVIAALLLPDSVRAIGNSRAFFFGEEAAMTAGAGVAVVRDTGAFWYNPAGLGGVTYGKLELGLTAYRYELRTVKKYLAADLPSGYTSKDMSANDGGAIPSSLVYVFNVNDSLTWGLAYFTTRSTWIDAQANMKVPYGVGDVQWDQGVEYHEQTWRYSLGPAVGWQAPNKRFRIGGSLLFQYDAFVGSYQSYAALIPTPDDTLEQQFFTENYYLSERNIGFMLTAGIQWEFVQNWHLGLVVRSPMVGAVSWGNRSEVRSGQRGPEGETETTFYSSSEDRPVSFRFEQEDPFEFQLALAYRTDKWWVGAEATFRPPLSSKDQNWLWNVSVGGRAQFTDTFSWGMGFFTDQTSEQKPVGPLAGRQNQYGLSTGVQFATPLTVKGKKGDRKLVWTNTIALSIAFELAEINGFFFDPESDERFSFPTIDSVFVNGALHVGSGLAF